MVHLKYWVLTEIRIWRRHRSLLFPSFREEKSVQYKELRSARRNILTDTPCTKEQEHRHTHAYKHTHTHTHTNKMKFCCMYSNVEYNYSSLAWMVDLSSETWIQLQYFPTEICGGIQRVAVKRNTL